MNEALKLTNQDVISLFKEHFGNAGAVVDFMPKTSYDILAYISYWKEKKQDVNISTWWKTECNQQISKLEQLMISATNLAVDFIGEVESIEVKLKDAEEIKVDKENLLTLDEVRHIIQETYRSKGEDLARSKGKELLKETHFKDGTVLMPEAVEGCINLAIKEVKGSAGQLADPMELLHQKVAKIKDRFPSLGENITDDECIMIDTYDRLFDKYDKSRKEEDIAHLNYAKTRFSKLSEDKKNKIKNNALKKYNELPSEEKATCTEDRYIVAYYASTLQKKEPIIDFCNPKGTFEEEREAMKEVQERVADLLSKNNKEDAWALARLFFGNFGEKYFDVEKGRNWSDQDINAWISWIITGFPEGEWHLYKQWVKDHDLEEDKKAAEIRKKRNEIKFNKQEMPEQLKAELVELMETNLKGGKVLKSYIEECKALFKEHKHEYTLGELTTLYKHIREMSAEYVKEEKTSKIFVRNPIKESNPKLWSKAEAFKIVTPSGLYNFLKENNPLWTDALNLAHDILSELPQGDTKRNWNEVEIEDWFDKYIEKGEEPVADAETDLSTNKVEEIQTEKTVEAKPTIEIEDVDFILLQKAENKTKLRRAVETIVTKYGIHKKVLSIIAHQLQNIRHGYGRIFKDQPIAEIYPFILGACRRAGLLSKEETTLAPG